MIIAAVIAFSALQLFAFADELEPVEVSIPKEALPTSSGLEALREQFEDDVAPSTNGFELDYKYYSPVGENDTTKYPIVIFFHGIGHGTYVGSQLADSGLAYWSSSELQSRFEDAGGAFIIMPRCPENYMIYWGDSLVDPVRALIDDFIAKHKENVDTTRIAITGSSQGGAMVWKMLDAYPEYFSAAFPIASTETPFSGTIRKASGTAIWLIASKYDPIINYAASTLLIWAQVKASNKNPGSCRLSTFGNVVKPDGTESSDNHHLAEVISYDLHTLDDGVYPSVETVDGNGNIVDLISPNGLISWISTVHSDFDGVTKSKEAGILEIIFNAIEGFFQNIGLFIVRIFQRALGL